MQDEIWKLDGLGQAELIRRGELAPDELTRATLRRIERLNPDLNAVSAIYEKRALERAGQPLAGPFAGVPLLIKDLLPYPGMVNTMGSRLFAQNYVSESTPYSRALEAAGFVALGKTTTSEFGLLGSTESLLHGRTRNPHDPTRSATGSSGGSAAAVAAGMTALAHASDGGGSIRIPAAVHGLFGLKPGAGRTLPSGMAAGRFTELLSDHCVTKSVRDSAAFLDVTERKGDDAKFAPVGFVERPLARSLKIGFYSTLLIGSEPPEPVRAGLMRTVGLLEELGHEVIPVRQPDLDGDAISSAFFTLAGAAMSEVSRFVEGSLGLTVDDTLLEPFTLALIDWFRSLPADAVPRAEQSCDTAARIMNDFTNGYDVLLTPTLSMRTPKPGFLAPTLDRETLIRRTERFAGYTPIHNIAGMCAMSVPLFQGDDGLPQGSHFAAPPGEEALLLGLAYQLEEAAPWSERLPASESVKAEQERQTVFGAGMGGEESRS